MALLSELKRMNALRLFHPVYHQVYLECLADPSASPEAIAAAVGFSERSVRRTLARLHQAGFIERP